MSEIVIQVEGLSKKYRIGKADEKADTIVGSIINGLRQPLANFRQIRDMSRFDSERDTVFWALKDISFKVEKGGVLGIIGNNGAGKSTLLKILAQITEPSEGVVQTRGRVAALLEVGTGFHPELTGRENVYMNGTILGMAKKEIDRKFDEISNFSGVEKHIDTPVKFYSSGMRMRLGFSVAAHLEPEILIIDEVLAVGDMEFQKKCIGKIEEVSKSGGRTVLFVSHNMHAIGELCDSAILLDKGVISYSGSASEAINRYTFKNDIISEQWVTQQPLLSNEVKTFEEIYCYLRGNQPDMKLEIYFKVCHNDSNHASCVAFDIINSLGDTIMQAFPTMDKEVKVESGDTYLCSIQLPGLIPGKYYVSCWMGVHSIFADSYVDKAVSFVINQSPTKGRTSPHMVDKGFVVPDSFLRPI